MQPDIAALVGSRICHDLISPIGAIGNGVELLELTDGQTGAEMDLISQSVQHASARIRYFRIAYGTASPDQMVGRSEIQSILTDTARNGRVNYIWQIEGDQPRTMVRCALLMLQAVECALPLGGDIRVFIDGSSWVMRAQGPKIALDHDLWDHLNSPDGTFTGSAAQVQFALLPTVLQEAGRKLAMTEKPDRLVVRF